MVIPPGADRYVNFDVSVYDLSGASPVLADADDLTIEVAFVPPGTQPDGDDWLPGDWHEAQRARVLVGPNGDVQLPVGPHDMWARVRSEGESFPERIGQVIQR